LRTLFKNQQNRERKKENLIEKYVSFMGGDGFPEKLSRWKGRSLVWKGTSHKKKGMFSPKGLLKGRSPYGERRKTTRKEGEFLGI